MDVRAFLHIEAALTKRLQASWRPIFADAYKRMQTAVSAGHYAQAQHIARDLDLGPVAKRNRQYIKYMLWNAAVFGAKIAANDDGPIHAAIGAHEKLLNHVADLFQKTLEYNVTQACVDRAMQSIAEAEERGRKQVYKAAGTGDFVRGFVSFKDTGDEQLRMTASLHASRLSTWGFTAEADVRGITTYALEAVLDGRTSKFCTFINGKTFPVEDARRFIVNALSATSPDDLKSLAPWPQQTVEAMKGYEKMTTQELAALGYFVPPFHPHCRTICVPVGFTVISATTTSQSLPDAITVTGDEFDEVKIKITDKQLTYWNQVMSQSPAYVLAQMGGITPAELLESKFGKALAFNEDGSLSFTVKGDITGAGGADKVNMVFDPFTGKLYANSMTFQGADPADAAETVKKIITGAKDVLSVATGTALVLNAAGTIGVFSQLGFLPSKEQWMDLRDIMLDRLEKLPLPAKQLAAARMILQSDKPKALWALDALPYEYDGRRLGAYLLEGQSAELSLDLSDKDSLAMFGSW